jgi:zinc protease
MKRIILYTTGLLLTVTTLFAQKETPPAGGQPRDFNLPKRETVILPNGLKASLIPYGTIPKATVSLYVRTGNMHEQADEVWLSDLLAELMKEGTNSRTAQELSEAAARMGGSISVSSTPSAMIISGSVLSEFTPELVRLLANLKRQLTVQKAQPQSQAFEKFLAAMYPDQPYGRTYPTEEMINGFDIARVQNFYRSQVGAQRTHVYVAGRFVEADVENAIQQAFGSWQKGPEPNIPKAQPASGKDFALIDRPGAPQTTIIVGLPVIDPSHPDFVALQITNSLLGGSFGSRITRNIREDKGYTYSPYSSVSSRFRSATWAQQADVTTEHTEASLKEIAYEIKRLQTEAPSPDELEGIQNYQAGVFVLQNSNPNGIISQLAFVDFHGLDESYLTNYVKNIHAVTPEKVQQMVQKYIRPEDMTVVLVGDQRKVSPQLQTFKPAENRSQSK